MADPGAARSGIAWTFMVAYFGRCVRRHLNALRLAEWGRPAIAGHPGPVVVYCNHPSWWDAAIIILLADRLFPKRISYAPFDARMLERYGVFSRIGAFAVDLDSARGAAQFLRAARSVLARPDTVMWVTAQGRFVDIRVRPLGLKAGIAHLPEIAPDAVLVPLALEYGFWDERGAEAFAAFGEPIPARDLLGLSRTERLARLDADLTAILDRLGADVIARDPAPFTDLVAGAKGVGGVYDGWRRLKAFAAGRRFDPAHRASDAPRKPAP